MNIYDVLKKDHREVKTLIRKLETSITAKSPESVTLFEAIKRELGSHAKAEEDVFYIPLKMRLKERKGKRKAEETERDHRVTILLLNELSITETNSPEWYSVAKVLIKSVRQYIMEEEHDMFGLAKTHFTPAEAEAIAVKMKEKKNQYKDRIDEALREDCLMLWEFEENRSPFHRNPRMNPKNYVDATTNFIEINDSSRFDRQEKKSERSRS